MGQKEKFVQPEVEVENPNIPESVSKLYERYGLDFYEEYLNLVRKYNDAGVLEILPEHNELGVVSPDGVEIPLPDVKAVAIAVDWSLSNEEQEQLDGDDNLARRFLRHDLKFGFKQLLIDKSDQYKKMIANCLSNWETDNKIDFENVPLVFLLDVFNEVPHYTEDIFDFLEGMDKSMHSDVALYLIDDGKINHVYTRIDKFENLSSEVAEAVIRSGLMIGKKDRVFFSDDVDWDELRERFY